MHPAGAGLGVPGGAGAPALTLRGEFRDCLREWYLLTYRACQRDTLGGLGRPGSVLHDPGLSPESFVTGSGSTEAAERVSRRGPASSPAWPQHLFAQRGDGETISSRPPKWDALAKGHHNVPHTAFHRVYGKGN